MNFSKLKGTFTITFYNDWIDLPVQRHPDVSRGTKTKYWQPEKELSLGGKRSPRPLSAGRAAVPFSSLSQMVVSVVTGPLPSKWWVSRQTERAACPAWYRQQTLLQRTCSQWRHRQRRSERGSRGGRPPPHRHLPSALALGHPRRLPYQLLSLLSYCFPQTPAKYGPHGINLGTVLDFSR